MSKCKVSTKARIVSDAVKSMCNNQGRCIDVCANPIYKDPSVLGIMAPLIYDEIGINLCTTVALGVDISTTYPTVTNAAVRVLNATYAYGTDNVSVEAITGRQNCYNITLRNVTIQFAVALYDAACRLVDTIYPTAVFLPTDTTAPTYDEDTNPTSVELELFAPYGLTYTSDTAPTPIINFVGNNEDNNFTRQGVNLFAMAKLLNFDIDDDEVTIGLTLVLQSLYYVGYKVASAGKIEIPKGSIMTPEDTDCMKFVEGELLNLAIKPLDLGRPSYEEMYKNDDCVESNCCNRCENVDGATDDTEFITPTT